MINDIAVPVIWEDTQIYNYKDIVTVIRMLPNCCHAFATLNTMKQPHVLLLDTALVLIDYLP